MAREGETASADLHLARQRLVCAHAGGGCDDRNKEYAGSHPALGAPLPPRDNGQTARLALRLEADASGGVSTELTVLGADAFSVAAVREAHQSLSPGELADEVLETLAVVTTCRTHGALLVFLDLSVEGDRIQAVVEPATLRQHGGSAPAGLAISLLTRPGTTLRVHGRPGRTRRGELSIFASTLELLGLPPQPAAIAKAAQLVACGELDASVAAGALQCDQESLAEVVHALEAAGGDEEEPQCRLAIRSCAAALSADGQRRHRPQHFGRAELSALGACAAAHAHTPARPLGLSRAGVHCRQVAQRARRVASRARERPLSLG